MTSTQLINFITNELNEGNTKTNATGYDGEILEGGSNIKVTFSNNHKAQYARLLQFCAENDGIIIETNPGTLACTVRVND